MKPTSEELQNIFYSGFPASTSWQMLDELFIALSRDFLVYRREQLVPKDKYHILSNSVSVIEGLGPQEKGHMALKTIAAEWLKKQIGVGSVFESYFAGLHPDVCSTDYRFVMECGTTDPACIQIFLNDSRVQWAANIPYPFSEDTHLQLHIFSRGPKYADWQQEKINVMRGVFQKYHRR